MSETLTPSDEFTVNISGKEVQCRNVTDSRGRRLRISKLDLLQELDLIELAGAASANSRWMMIATLAACVNKIDDLLLPYPIDRMKFRAHVDRVGGDGVAAVAKAFADQLPPEGEEAPTLDTDVAKN